MVVGEKDTDLDTVAETRQRRRREVDPVAPKLEEQKVPPRLRIESL